MTDWRSLSFASLQTFDLLIKLRNTRLAGEELGISQSAVSQSLCRMRNVLGDSLFTRSSHGLVPTQFAIDVAPKISQLIELARALPNGVADFSPKQAEQTFSINLPEPAAPFVLPPLLADFRAAAPNCRLETIHFDGVELERKLESGEVRVAIDGPISTSCNIMQKKIFSHPISIIGHRDRFPSGTISLDEVNSCPSIVWRASKIQIAELEQQHGKMNIIQIPALRTSASSSFIPIIEKNPDFIAFTPIFVAINNSYRTKVCVLKADFPYHDHFSMSLYWHSSRTGFPIDTWFRNLVYKSLIKYDKDYDAYFAVNQRVPDSSLS